MFHNGARYFSSPKFRFFNPSSANCTHFLHKSKHVVPPSNVDRNPFAVTSFRNHSRSSLVQFLQIDQASSKLFSSYKIPTQNALNAVIISSLPPSAPRISMYFFNRTSGKLVVKCCSQSSIVGFSPGKIFNVPAIKSRKDKPVTSIYPPFLYMKYIGTSIMYSAYFSNPKSSSNAHCNVPHLSLSVSFHTSDRNEHMLQSLPSLNGEFANNAVASGCNANDV